MTIRAGLSAHAMGWEILLRQEGIPFRFVDLAEGVDPAEYSVVIVSRVPNGREAEGLRAYLKRGGAVLGSARHLSEIAEVSPRREPLEYLVSENDSIFSSVWLLDLALQGEIPREANRLRTHQNAFAVFAGEFLGGVGVIVPFDVSEAMCDQRGVAKAFYGRRDRLPSERVSMVAKGEVQHLVHDALTYLHHVRNIPYVHVWYYPGQARNVFAFRVDTDGGTREQIDALYDAIREAGVRATWFLDVRSHEQWIQHFESMVGQEIGVHCYDHAVHNDLDTNLRQLRRAKHVLETIGLSPEGFAAPYGVWNPALAAAVDQVGFAYASEFGYAYDAYPLHAATRDGAYAALQIPIHPISIGSLLRVGYRADAMVEYYTRVVRSKLLRNEPLFFYHHPGHRCTDVVAQICACTRQEDVLNMTMQEYGRWWRRRDETQVFLELRGMELHMEPAMTLLDNNVGLRVIFVDGKEALMTPAPVTNLRTLQSVSHSAMGPPADIRRIRETDPRRMLGDLYNAMLRRLR